MKVTSIKTRLNINDEFIFTLKLKGRYSEGEDD